MRLRPTRTLTHAAVAIAFATAVPLATLVAVPRAASTPSARHPSVAGSRVSGATDGGLGIVVMAHGGRPEWNASVAAAVEPLAASIPLSIAFGMAERDSLEAAIRELEAQGIERIAVVRLFVWGGSFRHQTEYLLGLRSDPPARFLRHGEIGHPTPSPIHSSAAIGISELGLVDSERIGEVLADRAAALSVDAATETVLIIGHGLGGDDDNDDLLAAMNARTRAVQARGFRRVVVETLREDWDDSRGAAEARIRAFVRRASAAGSRVIVVPLRLSGFGPYADVLEGLEYTSDGLGLLPHPAVGDWIRAAALRVACRKGWPEATAC